MKFTKIAILISFLLIIAFLIFDEVSFKNYYKSNTNISTFRTEISDENTNGNNLIKPVVNENNIKNINPKNDNSISLTNKTIDFDMHQFMDLAIYVTNEQQQAVLFAKVQRVANNDLKNKMFKKLSKINKDFFQMSKQEKRKNLRK